MTKFIAGLALGAFMASAGLLGVQWLGIESAKPQMLKRAYQDCKQSEMSGPQCLNRPGLECVQQIAYHCGQPID